MAVVREDMRNGHRLTDIRGGSTITRAFDVTGLVAAPSGQLLEALRDPAIPKIGDQYPGGELLFVVSVDVAPNEGANGARVECNYSILNRPTGGTWNQSYPVGRDGQDVKQISFSLGEKETTRDRANQPMTLNPPASYSNSSSYLTKATIPKATGRLIFERVEASPQGDRMRGLFGRVNQFALSSYPANTLLFAAYESISEDGGRSWQTTYGFDYDPDGWEHRDTWKDAADKSPADAVEQTFDPVPLADFSVLGLDFTDVQAPL